MHNNTLFGFHQHATRRALRVATIPPRHGIGAYARVEVGQFAGSDADQIAN
jgi:hypothetical protein